MISFKRALKPYLSAALLVSAALAALRFFAMLKSYDRDNELYNSGAALPVVYNILLVAFCIAAFSIIHFMKLGAPKRYRYFGTAVGFTSSLTGFMFLSSAALIAYFFLPTLFEELRTLTDTAPARGATTTSLVLMLIMLAAAIPSAVYYLIGVSRANKTSSQILSFTPILWSIFYLVFMYFDKSVVLNNPERLILQLSAICVMVFTASDSRYIIGVPKPKLYFPLALIAVIVIISACVPHIMLAAMLRIEFTAHTIACGIQLGVASYIISRLLSFLKNEPEESTAEQVSVAE